MKRRLISIILGGVAGYAYYYFIGCCLGTCAIKSNPIYMIFYGAILTGLIVELTHDMIEAVAKKQFIFNFIAPVYALFYNKQRKRFIEVLEKTQQELDLAPSKSILDVGCGTGALCSVLSEKGLRVTGIEPAENMLKVAMREAKNNGVTFMQADVLDRLPFDDNAFDFSIASYVAHGMQAEQRKKMYVEMSRVTKEEVIIYDYNKKRALLTTVIEWLERGDYFHFIKNAESEMENCVSEMKKCFMDVKVIDVSPRAAWYICTPLH